MTCAGKIASDMYWRNPVLFYQVHDIVYPYMVLDP